MTAQTVAINVLRQQLHVARPRLYNPRHPERTLLYQTIAEHFETWFELASSGQFDGQGERPVKRRFRQLREAAARAPEPDYLASKGLAIEQLHVLKLPGSTLFLSPMPVPCLASCARISYSLGWFSLLVAVTAAAVRVRLGPAYHHVNFTATGVLEAPQHR